MNEMELLIYFYINNYTLTEYLNILTEYFMAWSSFKIFRID